MQLKSLWIKDYKNLKDFSLDFEKGNGLSILIGNNGSGKSNVIEAISGIFHDLFLRKLKRKITSDYSLEYADSPTADQETIYKLEQKNGNLQCFVGNKCININKFIEDNAPNNIIGLYSGEENRLWIQFYQPYYNSYIKRLRSNKYQSRMRLMLIDKRYWNISLLVLLLSNNDTLKSFIQDELGITSIDNISLHFNFRYYENANELLKSFIDRINPEHLPGMEYKRDELNQNIFYNLITDEKGNIIVDENENSLVIDSGITDLDVFHCLTQACIPTKEKLIDNIDIKFNHEITLSQLSEGEKKLILVKTVLEFVADENSLLLLDEPDANIHEARKRKLYDLLRNTINRNVVMTTHSPIIAKMASEKELICLESKSNVAERIIPQKLDLIRKLASNEWNIIEAGVFLNSDKPLVLFEGKTDIDFVKRAMELLKEDIPEYGQIDVNFLSFNGTGNAKDFLKNIRTITKTKKVIFFFDRDDGGKKGMASIAEKSKDDETIVHFRDFYDDEKNIRAAFLPYPQEITEGDFMIEDYFSNDLLVKIINKISELSHPVTKLPKLGDKIKEVLAADYMNYKKSDFEGFKPLLDKLLEMLEYEK